MDETQWDMYGTGRYEKCKDCMVHCGYEATAVEDTLSKPIKAMLVNILGVKTRGTMAPEPVLNNARAAEDLHDKLIEKKLEEIRNAETAS